MSGNKIYVVLYQDGVQGFEEPVQLVKAYRKESDAAKHMFKIKPKDKDSYWVEEVELE